MRKRNIDITDLYHKTGFVKGIVIFGVIVFVVFVVDAIFSLLNFTSYEESNKIECISNMMQIRGAKKMWARESGAKQGQSVKMEVIDSLMPEKPVCLEGGVYKYNEIGVSVECSIHGSLEELERKENEHNGINP